MEVTSNNASENRSIQSKEVGSGYNYFAICHAFVNRIKALNELQQLGKIKTPGFS